MKNSIPIVIAVLLAVAAVFAVSKVVKENDAKTETAMVQIVVADEDLPIGGTFEEEKLAFREVPADAVPRNALLWRDVKVAWGQTVSRPIGDGETILVSDVRSQLSLADCARAGEWTIPVTFENSTLVPLLHTDDEIAILATWKVQADDTESSEPGGGQQTTLLMPCVRVHGIIGENGSFRDGGASATTILVSLPPQEAEMLVAVQSVASLTPVLRKRSDESARNRSDGGVISARTFRQLRQNLPNVDVSGMKK